MPHAILLLEGTLSSLLLTISPETALRAQPRTCCIARATVVVVSGRLIPSNDRQAAAVALALIRRGALALEEAGEGAAAVAVADEEMDKSKIVSPQAGGWQATCRTSF